MSFVGATPVFVETVEGEYNIDPEQVRAAITPRTKAVIPVHLYGIPADMDPIMKIADEHNLIVIEDASQAHGSEYKGRRIGSIGHIAAFSLYPAKNLGAFGQAGVITTNDNAVVDKIKAIRNCGQTEKYYHEYAPHNSRLDTMQAAVLSIKLRELDGWNAGRRQVAAWYNELLADVDVVRPRVADDINPVWHLYVVRTSQREALMQYLGEHGVASGIHYPFPLHLTGYYSGMDYNEGDFPMSEKFAHEILSLPMYPHMTREQVEHVANTIQQFKVNEQNLEAIKA